jgi:hypothetical protein
MFLFRSLAGLPGCEPRRAQDPQPAHLSQQLPSLVRPTPTGDRADLRALAYYRIRRRHRGDLKPPAITNGENISSDFSRLALRQR